MLRHHRFVSFLTVYLIISTVGVLGAFFISETAGWLVLALCTILCVLTMLFTKNRYTEIKQLSTYLRQISNGNFTLDVRDNFEGELSILKSEMYKVTRMLSEHADILQADKRQLTDAISDISHQLKTPITSMTLMADLLNDDTLPAAKRAEFTKTIRQQLERIEWLVSSLLKLSKIDAGTAQFKEEDFLATALIEKAMEPVLIPVDIRQQTISLQGDTETMLHADINWTTEALINILKNAVTHTPEAGKIEITLMHNALFTEITIQDDGPGIPKEDLPYIFKRFYRGKNATGDSVGIGLAMAYSIITEQGGDIEVDSSAQTGTCFRIKFYKK